MSLQLIALSLGEPVKKLTKALIAAVAVACTGGPGTVAAGESMHQGNEFWWPDRLNLEQLRDHDPASNPYGEFDYAAAFAAVDLDQLKADIEKTLTTSQDWWPDDPLCVARGRHLPGS
jgi:catalase-peroxidase